MDHVDSEDEGLEAGRAHLLRRHQGGLVTTPLGDRLAAAPGRQEGSSLPPTLTVPEDLTVEADGPNGAPASHPDIAAFLARAAAADGQGAVFPVATDAPARFPLGATAITFAASDADNNGVTATATVTVVDTVSPILAVPPDLTLGVEHLAGVPASDPAIVAFLAGASAQDRVDPAPALSRDAPALFPPGTTAVTFQAADAAGNSTSATATVEIQVEIPAARLFANLQPDGQPRITGVTIAASAAAGREASGDEVDFTLILHLDHSDADANGAAGPAAIPVRVVWFRRPREVEAVDSPSAGEETERRWMADLREPISHPLFGGGHR